MFQMAPCHSPHHQRCNRWHQVAWTRPIAASRDPPVSHEGLSRSDPSCKAVVWYRAPIGKACLPSTIFQGRTIKLRGRYWRSCAFSKGGICWFLTEGTDGNVDGRSEFMIHTYCVFQDLYHLLLLKWKRLADSWFVFTHKTLPSCTETAKPKQWY